MTHTITFDTLAVVKKLEASGWTPNQAEGLTEVMQDIFEENLNAAIFTKNDAQLLKAELKTDVEVLKAELKTDVEVLKAELKTDAQVLRSELKKDAQMLQAELKTDAQVLRSELKKDVQVLKSELKTEIISWVMGLLFAQTALMVSLMKFIH